LYVKVRIPEIDRGLRDAGHEVLAERQLFLADAQLMKSAAEAIPK